MSTDNQRNEPDLFIATLQSANADGGYTGDSACVESLLRQFGASAMAIVSRGGDDAETKVASLATKAAKVFIGEAPPGVEIVPHWNVPESGIVSHLSELFGLSGTGEEVVASVLMRLVMQSCDIASDIDGSLEEQWRWQIDGLYQEFTNHLIGLSAAAIDVAEADGGEIEADAVEIDIDNAEE